ncbi:MAG: peptide chain release factor 2 [Thermoleophilia bacterium]|nr:peptide chain release factor 2 [Thermoleophilia bacterium]
MAEKTQNKTASLVEYRELLSNLREKFAWARDYFDPETTKRDIAALEDEMRAPGFWDDQARAQQVSTRYSRLRSRLEDYENLRAQMADFEALIELAEEECVADQVPEELAEEIERLSAALGQELERLEEESLFTGEFDAGDAIVSIHPGAGGTESQDWAEMLLRMYLRWAQSRGFTVELNEVTEGEEAGIKSATFTVHGRNAYGLLSTERGVHRLVRISPFDANARRHTSFASVDVTPLVEGPIDVEIDEKDLRIETYRSSGAGGQHVNKTDSAVRITHLPTRIVVQCQNERSQIQNRETAMRMLKSKLLQYEREKHEQELAREKGEQKEIAWGNQIRSYVLAPYTLVKDHRTNYEKGNVAAVLDGAIDDFIREYIRQKSTGRLGKRSGQ